jgi:hypothetical protein
VNPGATGLAAITIEGTVALERGVLGAAMDRSCSATAGSMDRDGARHVLEGPGGARGCGRARRVPGRGPRLRPVQRRGAESLRVPPTVPGESWDGARTSGSDRDPWRLRRAPPSRGRSGSCADHRGEWFVALPCLVACATGGPPPSPPPEQPPSPAPARRGGSAGPGAPALRRASAPTRAGWGIRSGHLREPASVISMSSRATGRSVGPSEVAGKPGGLGDATHQPGKPTCSGAPAGGGRLVRARLLRLVGA